MGYVTDGNPLETPMGAANQTYAETLPSFGSGVAAEALETSPVRMIAGWLRRGVAGAQGISGALARGMTIAAGQEGGMSPEQMGLTREGNAQTSPVLTPEEANAKYAPMGADGKPTKIADQPIPEAVAKVIGEQRADQIERQGVISRFQNVHSWPVNFGTGMAAFMMDPLNAATAFVPGFGEEATAAALGRGLGARLAGKAVSGAVAGAVSQAPLTALKYAMGSEEGDEYSLRDAFRDMTFAAAGNAIISAGIGALGEALGRKAVETPPPKPAPEDVPAAAQTILKADAQTKYDAMKTAVAQVADGREVNVSTMFPTPKTDTAIGRFLPPMPGETPAITTARIGVDDLARQTDPETFVEFDRLAEEHRQARAIALDPSSAGAEVDRQVAALEAQAAVTTDRDEWRKMVGQSLDLRSQRDAIVSAAQEEARARAVNADEGMRDLATRVTAAYDGARSQLGLDEAMRQTRNPMLNTQGRPITPAIDVSQFIAENPDIQRSVDLSRFASEQRDIYEKGYSPALAQPEYDRLDEEIYGSETKAEEPLTPTATKEAKGETVPASEIDKRLAVIQDNLKTMQENGTRFHPEDAAAIQAANENLEKADLMEGATQEAVGCLGIAAQ